MKITSDYLKALQQTAETRKPESAAKAGSGSGFEEQLMQALSGGGQAQAAEGLAARELGAAGLALDTFVAGADAQREEGYSTLMDEFAQILDGFDAYTETIGSPGGANLKSAYAALENVSGALSGLKERAASGETMPEGFQAMLNELEIMTVTEQFKLNRGDYL